MTLENFRYTAYSDPRLKRDSQGNLISLQGTESNLYGKKGVWDIKVHTSTTSIDIIIGSYRPITISFSGHMEGRFTLDIGVYYGGKFIPFYTSGILGTYDPITVNLVIPEVANGTTYELYYRIKPLDLPYNTATGVITKGTEGPVTVTAGGALPVGSYLQINRSGTIVRRRGKGSNVLTYNVISELKIGSEATSSEFIDYFPFFEGYCPNDSEGNTILSFEVGSNNRGDLGIIRYSPKVMPVFTSNVLPEINRKTAEVAYGNFLPWTFEGTARQTSLLSAEGDVRHGTLEYNVPKFKGIAAFFISAGHPFSTDAGYYENLDARLPYDTVMTIKNPRLYIKEIQAKSKPEPYKEVIYSVPEYGTVNLNTTIGNYVSIKNKASYASEFRVLVDPRASYYPLNATVFLSRGGEVIGISANNVAVPSGESPFNVPLTLISSSSPALITEPTLFISSSSSIYLRQPGGSWATNPVDVLVIDPPVGKNFYLTISGAPEGCGFELRQGGPVSTLYGSSIKYSGSIVNNTGASLRSGSYQININLLVDGVLVTSTKLTLNLEM